MKTLLCIPLLVVAACSGDTDEPAPETAKAAEPAPAAPAGEPAPIAATPTPVTDPGPAYFGVENHGVVRLRDGTFERLVESRYSIRDIDVGPDGTVWAAAIGGIYRIQGDDAGQVGGHRSPGSMERIAGGPNGTAWAVGSGGVAHFDGTGWTVQPRDVVGAKLLGDVAIDGDGRVWVLSSNAVHVREGDTWKVSDTGTGDPKKTFFERLEVGPDGTLYATCNRGVLRHANGSWSEVSIQTGYAGVDELAIGVDGTLAGQSGLDDIYLVAGGATRHLTGDSAGFRAKRVDGIELDGSGRAWLATDYGVVVLSKDGGVLQQWAPGSVPELPGTVQVIATVGGGPALPEVGEQKKGSLRGRIVKGGAGVAGAEVEMCESPSTMFRVSPCDTAVLRQRVETDDQGYFQVDELPIGSYGFAIRTSKKAQWLVMIGAECCGQMQPGKVYDVGSIPID